MLALAHKNRSVTNKTVADFTSRLTYLRTMTKAAQCERFVFWIDGLVNQHVE